MSKIKLNWRGVFSYAYTYSSNYLLFTLTLIIASVVWVWIYEKPQFYKLIFKKSKHSNILSPVHSNVRLEIEHQVIENNTIIERRITETSKEVVVTSKGFD